MKSSDLRMLGLLAIALVLILGAALLLLSPVEAGGGGYCSPLNLRLGGCQPVVKCDIGKPIIDYDWYDDQYILKCQQDPQAPESGSPAASELAGLIGGRNE